MHFARSSQEYIETNTVQKFTMDPLYLENGAAYENNTNTVENGAVENHSTALLENGSVAKNDTAAAENRTSADEDLEHKVKSLKDLEKSIDNWNLYEDNELMNYLSDYSKKFFEKTKKVQLKLSQMENSSHAVEIRLNNILNTFLMLTNTQFIENRVYDDEAEEETEVENTVENTKSTVAVVDKYRKALDMGRLASKLFVTRNSDTISDDSTDEDAPVDIYYERPLPYIIGTRDFLEDDMLGLGGIADSESSVSESASEKSYSQSGSSSGEDDGRRYSDDDASQSRDDDTSIRYSDEESSSDASDVSARPVERQQSELRDDDQGLFQVPSPRRSRSIKSRGNTESVFWSDDDDDEELFGYDDSESTSLFGQVERAKKERSRQDSVQSSSLFSEPRMDRSKEKVRYSVAESSDNFSSDSDEKLPSNINLFNDPNTPLEEPASVDRIAKPSFLDEIQARGKIRQESSDETSVAQEIHASMPVTSSNKNRGVFDSDSDDDGDLFSMIPPSAKLQDKSQKSATFNSHSDAAAENSSSRTVDQFPASQDAFSSRASPSSRNAKNKLRKGMSLFESDSDDDASTGLFGSTKEPSKRKISTKQPIVSENDLFNRARPPPGSSSESSFESDGSSAGLFNDQNQTSATPDMFTRTMNQSGVHSDSESSFGSDDESSSGLFGARKPSASSKNIKTTPNAPIASNTTSRDGLFGRAMASNSPDSGSSFGSDDDSTGLFGAPSRQPSSKSIKSTFKDTPAVSNDGLFGRANATQVSDSDSESAFGSDDDSTGLFGAPKQQASSKSIKASATPTANQASSGGLFGQTTEATAPGSDSGSSFGDDDGSTGLFGTPSKQPSSKSIKGSSSSMATANATPNDGLFGRAMTTAGPDSDSDSAFGSDNESSTGLFGAPKQQASSKSINTSYSAAPVASAASNDSLFGRANASAALDSASESSFGSDDDSTTGLFGAQKRQASSKSIKAATSAISGANGSLSDALFGRAMATAPDSGSAFSSDDDSTTGLFGVPKTRQPSLKNLNSMSSTIPATIATPSDSLFGRAMVTAAPESDSESAFGSDDESTTGLFGAPKKQPSSKSIKSIAPVSAQFDSNKNESEGLFGASSSSKNAQEKEDVPMLFGSSIPKAPPSNASSDSGWSDDGTSLFGSQSKTL